MFTAMCLMFAVILGRTAYIGGNSAYPAIAADKSVAKYVLGKTRGKIYDVNMTSFYPSEEKQITVKLKSTDENGNGFAVTENGKNVDDKGICSETVTVYEELSKNTPCRHIIGYLGNDSSGVCGIQRAFDRILSEASGELVAEYRVNALGQVLPGGGVKIINDNYNSPAGIVLTVDLRIQQVVESALANSKIERGACVVLRPSSGEIVAIASVPEYDVTSLGRSLTDKNKPFLNRALCAYPVGSVFKPFIAAAAASDGCDLNAEYECEGSVGVGDTVFNCYEHRHHGKINLTGAIENSCNCYFIDRGMSTSNEKIYSVCSAFGFGSGIRLFAGTESASGNMPHYGENTANGQTASLCFGQGELLASPLQLAAAYGALANGGTYIEPYILKYLVDGNGDNYAEYRTEKIATAASAETCALINEALYMNMLRGTGKNGRPDTCSSAGKTATAQTGEYDENGVERLCTWFAGFFPFETPQYVAVVFNENGSAAAVDCAPVFKEIADGIMTLPKLSSSRF